MIQLCYYIQKYKLLLVYKYNKKFEFIILKNIQLKTIKNF